MGDKSEIVDGKAKPLANYPHFKRAGNFVFVSGTSARQADDSVTGALQDEDGTWQLDIKAQTAGAIDNVADYLKSAGCGLEDIVEISVFLKNMGQFADFNAVYNSYFPQGGPARTTVEVSDLPRPELLIELKVIAHQE